MARFGNFRIRWIESGGDDKRLSTAYIRSLMANVDFGAQFGKPLRNSARSDIGARDLVPQREQDLRNATHPNAPDSHEVDVLGLKKHLLEVLFPLS
jgi:hypothetical protein